MIHADGQRIAESAQLHFVIIPRIEQRHRLSIVEPLLEFLRRQLRRSALGGRDSLHAKRDYLALQPHQHPLKRLLVRLAQLPLQTLQPRQRPQQFHQRLHIRTQSRDKKIHTLRAQ